MLFVFPPGPHLARCKQTARLVPASQMSGAKRSIAESAATDHADVRAQIEKEKAELTKKTPELRAAAEKHKKTAASTPAPAASQPVAAPATAARSAPDEILDQGLVDAVFGKELPTAEEMLNNTDPNGHIISDVAPVEKRARIDPASSADDQSKAQDSSAESEVENGKSEDAVSAAETETAEALRKREQEKLDEKKKKKADQAKRAREKKKLLKQVQADQKKHAPSEPVAVVKPSDIGVRYIFENINIFSLDPTKPAPNLASLLAQVPQHHAVSADAAK